MKLRTRIQRTRQGMIAVTDWWEGARLCARTECR
jgi:hypothetical protein